MKGLLRKDLYLMIKYCRFIFYSDYCIFLCRSME